MNATGAVNASALPGVMALAGALLVGSETVFGQTDPPSFDVTAVIHDFSRGHSDFNVIPLNGYGYYAGNVAIELDAAGKPVFTGEGYKQASPIAKDAAGKPIAPHLVNTCGLLAGGGDDGGDPGVTSFYLTASDKVRIKKHSVIDSFDSNVGPYGDENSGEAALVQVNGTGKRKRLVKVERKSTIMGDVMVGPGSDLKRAVRIKKKSTVTGTIGHLEAAIDIPDVEAPEMGPSVGKVRYKGGEHILSEDLHCRRLKLKRGAVLTIEGDVTILCDDKLELDDGSEIRLMEGATLTLFVGRKVEVDDGSMLNMNTGNPQLVSINMLSAHDDDDDDDDDDRQESKVKIDDGSMVAAWVQGVDAYLKVDDGSEFFGSFRGRKVKVEDRSKLHVDMATADATTGGVAVGPEPCDLGDRPGAIGVLSTADIASASTFAEWWRDILGVNQSMVVPLHFTNNGAGVYYYFDNDFRPIDGLLLGNEGDVHNYHFTAEFDAGFTYNASAGQFFEFRGTDDVYVFINGKLVIDLGGMNFNRIQRIDLDRLGLEDGAAARLQFFHAQRQRGLAIFRLRTNLVLGSPDAFPSVNSVLED